MKTLKDFLERLEDTITTGTINESTFLDKGISVYQKSKHSNASSKLKNVVSKIQTSCSNAKNQKEVAKKLDAILDILSLHALATLSQAEMSDATMNAIFASTFLEQDIEKILQKVISKHFGK